MGRIFTSWFTKPGEYETDDSGNPVRYPEGHKKAGRPKPKRFESETFTIEWTDANGTTVRRGGFKKRSMASEALTKNEAEAIAERNGLAVGSAADVPCQELLDQYLVALAAGASKAHVRG